MITWNWTPWWSGQP